MSDVTHRAIVENIVRPRAINAEASVDSQNYRITLYVVCFCGHQSKRSDALSSEAASRGRLCIMSSKALRAIEMPVASKKLEIVVL